MASKYDSQITSTFEYNFPNGFQIEYYEGVYSIYDNLGMYPIVYAGHEFPISQYDSIKNTTVEVEKILKVTSLKRNFILLVQLKDGQYRYIIIEEYYKESIIKKYKILNQKDFDKLNFELEWIVLGFDNIPFIIRLWSIVGYLVLIRFLFLFLKF